MTESSLWVVYRREIHGKPTKVNAVCEQGEWDAMEQAHPGRQKLVQKGIVSEAEAEQLARNLPAAGHNDEISKTDSPNLL